MNNSTTDIIDPNRSRPGEHTTLHPVAFANVAGQLSPSSIRIYENDAEAFATWLNEGGYSLTREHIIEYRAYLAAHYKPTTAQRMWSVVTRILKEQVITGHLSTNPAEGVRGFKVSGNASKYIALTEEEASHLLSMINIGTKMGLRDFALILLLLKTGLRRFEASAVNIEDLQAVQGHQTLFLKETKGSKLDRVKITPDVYRSLTFYLEACKRGSNPTAPLFVSFKRGDHPLEKRLLPGDIYSVIKDYGKLAGIDKLSPHALRASFITIALANDVPLHKVQYAARHEDSRTTEHYDKRRLNLDDAPADHIKIKLPGHTSGMYE